MNTRSSSYTGRAPRDLNGAFGPYARGPIHDSDGRWSAADHIVVWASLAALVVWLVSEFIGAM